MNPKKENVGRNQISAYRCVLNPIGPAVQMMFLTSSRVFSLCQAISVAFFLLAFATTPMVWAQKDSEPIDGRAMGLLQEHCLDCHGHSEPEAGLNLEHFKTLGSVRFESDIWEKVLQRIASGSMPPADASELPEDEKEWLAQWVDDALHKIDCSDAIFPGEVTIRRLTKLEYRNSIRDLLGYDYSPAMAFPGDDTGYGFDNIGDVLSLPPVLMEKYLDAAEVITANVIHTPENFVPPSIDLPLASGKREGGVNNDGAELTFFSDGTVTFEKEFEAGGEYEIRVSLTAEQAGPEPCKMTVYIDGQAEKSFSIKDHEKFETVSTVQRIKAGKRKIGVSFDNDYYDEKGPKGRNDRNLFLKRLTIVGPREFNLANSDLHKRFFFTYPKKKSEEEAFASRLLSVWSSRFFRRPTAPHEVQALSEIYSSVRKDGSSFEQAMQVALQAILVSPKFLYKVERPAPEDGSPRDLTNFELATSLSYFIWGTTPDDLLLRAAAQQDLQEPAILKTQVQRLLQSDRSEQLVENFAVQWLQLRALADFQPDPQRFQGVDAELLADMRKETELFCREILRADKSILELLDADFTFVNGRLAKHYSLAGVPENKAEFVKVSLAGSQRGGLLTHASILSVTSNPTRTSPVKRGKWIMENMLGEPPPPAAPDVVPLDKQELKGTLREQMEQHRADPSCASCHQLMDPLGFALENFDAVGRWREKDGKSNIDASGVLPSGENFNGISELKKILTNQQKDKFVRCLTQKMLTYALGRGLRYEDQCAVNDIVKRLQENEYRISELVLGIVQSAPFRQRQSKIKE